MKTAIFLIIVLISGALAGFVHGTVNFAIVEPYLDQAIGIENQNLFASGEAEDTPQFWAEYEGYRIWQKSGQVLAGVVLGTSIGALFGLVFAFSRNILPGNNDIKKAIVLAGIMWFTMYLIPFLKYPANPPTVGDAEPLYCVQYYIYHLLQFQDLVHLDFTNYPKNSKIRKKLLP